MFHVRPYLGNYHTASTVIVPRLRSHDPHGPSHDCKHILLLTSPAHTQNEVIVLLTHGDNLGWHFRETMMPAAHLCYYKTIRMPTAAYNTINYRTKGDTNWASQAYISCTAVLHRAGIYRILYHKCMQWHMHVCEI